MNARLILLQETQNLLSSPMPATVETIITFADGTVWKTVKQEVINRVQKIPCSVFNDQCGKPQTLHRYELSGKIYFEQIQCWQDVQHGGMSERYYFIKLVDDRGNDIPESVWLDSEMEVVCDTGSWEYPPCHDDFID